MKRIVIGLLICIAMVVITYYLGNNDVNANGNLQINDYHQKMLTVKNHINNTPPEVCESYYYKMHELYYNGVPDKYDVNNNKIKGIEPNADKSLHWLRKAIECRNNPKLWSVMASIYQNGMYNFDPDLEAAANIYQYIYYTFPHTDSAVNAYDEYQNTIQEINTIKTYRWLNREYKPKKNEHHEKIKKLFQSNNGPLNNNFLIGRPTTTVNRINFFRADPANAGGAEILDIDDPKRNDMHNTHNSQVVSTVANSVNKLKEQTTIKMPVSDTLRDIYQFINSHPESDKKQDALKSLNSIERNILPITSVNMKEVDVLNLVWNRIYEPIHEQNRKDIKDIFYDQLADMQEHGKSVCPTGRLERLVDSLNTFDENVSIKPTYIINTEMMDKASNIREQLYNEIKNEKGELAVDQYKKGNASDQDQFDQRLKTNIVEVLKKDYVEPGIVTEGKFNTMIEKWIDEI